MKKITKIVTREEDLFIARDGKEFEDEDECLWYENELNIEDIEAYDENFDRVSFDRASYVVVHSDEELNFITEVCGYNGWSSEGFCGKGLYRYSCNRWGEDWEKVKIPYFLKDFIEFI